MLITESLLLKISVLGTVVGLVLLFSFSSSLQAENINVANITKGFEGKYVNVTGTIQDVKKSDSGLSFSLNDGDKKIRVLVWNNVLEELQLSGVPLDQLKEGAKINLVGIVQVWKGQAEVVPVRAELNILG